MTRILLIAMLSVLSAGCDSSRQARASVLIVDGCVIDIQGISAETAASITKEWDVGDDCKLTHKSTSGRPVKD